MNIYFDIIVLVLKFIKYLFLQFQKFVYIRVQRQEEKDIGMLYNNIGFLLMGVDGVEVFGFGIIVGLKFGIFVFFFFEVMWCFF